MGTTMDSSEATTAVEQTNLPTDSTPKKKAKVLGGSERKRYQALRQLNVPPAEAVELSKKTFAELRQMGYKFGNLQRKPGKKPVKQTSKTTKGICSKRSRHDALKKIGVSSNLKELSKKSFAELKQLGFKFTQKPSEKSVDQSFKAVPEGTPETPKVTDFPTPQRQACSIQGIRVGIKDANPMTDSQLETLSHTILETIAGMSQGEGPRFKGYSRKPGWLLITCTDQHSKHWLEKLVPALKPWPEANLAIIPESELPKPNIAVVFIPNIDTTMIEQSLSLIRAQNALQTELWKILNSKAQRGGVILTLSLDSLSVENLQKQKLKANLGFHVVQFRLKGLKAHQSKTDSFFASLPMDQSLPGTSSSDPNLAPAAKIHASTLPFHPTADSPDTRKVFHVPTRERYSDIESSSMGEDIRRDLDGGTSYSGREDFNEGASYSSRENIPRVTSSSDRHDIKRGYRNCGEQGIRGDFAEGTSYSRRVDIRGDIDVGSSYNGREDVNKGASYSAIEVFRDKDDIDRGSSYSRRQYINRGDSYSGKSDIREDIRGGSSDGGREDIRGGNYGGTSYRNRVREDIRGDMNRCASYIGREVIARDTDGGTSYIGREDIRGDISGAIYYSDSGVIGGNQIRQQYPKWYINDDINRFGEKMYLREDRPLSPSGTGSFRDRDSEEDIRGLNRGITNFGSRGDGQIHQHFPLSTGSYRDWDIGEDIREINRGTSEFRGRSDSQIHRHFPPSTVTYRDRDIGDNIGRLNGGAIHQQFPPGTESYRERNFGEDRGVNGGTSFGGREDGKIHQSSSNWEISGINSMDRECTRGSQGYTSSVMHGHTRVDTQRYTRGDNRGFSTGDSQRYTRRDDQGYAKEDNQSYTRRD